MIPGSSRRHILPYDRFQYSLRYRLLLSKERCLGMIPAATGLSFQVRNIPPSLSQHYMPLEASLYPRRFRLLVLFWCGSLACAHGMQLVLHINLGRVKQAPPHTCSQAAATNSSVHSKLVDHPPAHASAGKPTESCFCHGKGKGKCLGRQKIYKDAVRHSSTDPSHMREYQPWSLGTRLRMKSC